MFDTEFYPTPKELLNKMQIFPDGLKVLEPSAGSGNIIDWLKDRGSDEIFSFEKNKDLAEIVKSKSTFLGYDFFDCKSQDVSHIDLVVMNPPFSNAHKHIKHAWEISPPGCEITALCNYDTINKNYTSNWRELKSIISEHGFYDYLGQAFKDSERKTNVSVALIKLFKPVEQGHDYDDFFLEEEEDDHGYGIVTHSELRAIVNTYVYKCKRLDEIAEIKQELSGNLSSEEKEFLGQTNPDPIKRSLQKKSWKTVFNKMNIEKFATTEVYKKINEFVNNYSHYPFSMKNVLKMIEIIVGTSDQNFNKGLVDAVDRFTKYTHGNRYDLPGWKSNSGHLLNKKFIVDGIVEQGWNGELTVRYSYHHNDKMNDLVKVMCNLTAKDYNQIGSLHDYDKENGLDRGEYHDWGFFRFKPYKKGTVHFYFKNEKEWELLNRKYAEIKGEVLPEKL